MINEKEKSFFRKARKLIVTLKFTMIRGYSWVSFMMLGIITAVSLLPYVKQYVHWIQLWQLIIFVVILLFLIGWLDVKYKFLHTEQDYTYERSPTLMKGLRGELKNESKNNVIDG